MDEHGGNIEQALKQYRLAEGAVIDFSANINPLGMPYPVKRAVTKAMDYLDRYPECEYLDLRKDLAGFYGVKPQNLLVDNGSVSLIYLIPRALGLRSALIIVPAFSEYEKAARLAKGEVKFLKSKADLSLDMDSLIKGLKGRDSLYLANPNNPTSLSVERKDLLKILKAAKENGAILILDEVFMEFSDSPRENTLISQAVKSENLIILRSMTKFFALAGLRLGAAIAHPDVISRLRKYQPPWPVNSLAVAAAREFLKDKKYIYNSYKLIQKEKTFLYSELSAFKAFKVWKPSANFVFCRIKVKNLTAAGLRDRLALKGILIRDCSNFRGLDMGFFRIAVRSRRENMKLLAGLKEALLINPEIK